MEITDINFKLIKTPEEIECLIKLIHKIWPEVFIPIIGKDQVDYMLVHYQGKYLITAEIEHGKQYFFILNNNDPIGYFAYTLEDDRLCISKVYLLKDFRGNGISSKIFSYFEETAKNNNKAKLSLRVNRNNKQAIDVYLHKGFKITETIDEPLGNFILNDYCMEKDV